MTETTIICVSHLAKAPRRPVKMAVCGLPRGALSSGPLFRVWCDTCECYEDLAWITGDELFDLAG